MCLEPERVTPWVNPFKSSIGPVISEESPALLLSCGRPMRALWMAGKTLQGQRGHPASYTRAPWGTCVTRVITRPHPNSGQQANGYTS